MKNLNIEALGLQEMNRSETILVFGGTFNALSDDWSKGGGGYNFTEGVDTKDLQNVTVTGKKPKSKDNSDLDVSMDSSKFVAKSPEQIHNDLCNGPWKSKDVCGPESQDTSQMFNGDSKYYKSGGQGFENTAPAGQPRNLLPMGTPKVNVIVEGIHYQKSWI